MLVAISTTSVVLVNQSRKDNGRVVHTVEVENQMNALLLELRRAESATRGFLLTSEPRFRAEYETAAAAVVADVDKLRSLIGDNPVQIENVKRLQQPIEGLLGEFARSIDFANRHDAPGGVEVMREADTHNLAQRMNDVVENMRTEEDRSLAQRTRTADGTQQLASVVTVAGSGLVIVLAAISIWLVRRSSRARDDAESRMRDNNLNLETMVDERTADLREANDEIQRFAYIVSHDLRSPLVNIMGFTSELEQLRGDIFRRIATLDRAGAEAPLMPADGDDVEPLLGGEDGQLSQDFAEALGFIKSSIAKMDRLISAILNLTREGRRRFEPVKIDIRELIAGIVATVAHQAAEAKAEIHIEPLPSIVSDRLAIEQILSNLIDNALKYLKPGVPGDIRVRGRTKLGFAIFEIADNGRGIDPRDHQRIFDLFRRAGTQDKPGEGIGLAYVRALVRRLGGTMSVTSELNRGSTFTITLPLVWATTNRNGDS